MDDSGAVAFIIQTQPLILWKLCQQATLQECLAIDHTSRLVTPSKGSSQTLSRRPGQTTTKTTGKDMVLHKTCSNLQSRYLGQSRCCDCNIPDFLPCPAEYGNMVVNCRKDRIEAKQSAPAQCHEQALASSSHVMMF